MSDIVDPEIFAQDVRVAEALIFASAHPVPPSGLLRVMSDFADLAAVLDAVRARHAGGGVELVEIGGGYQFRTAADLAPRLRQVVEVKRRLPRVAMETLAIIAYHQPVTRAEIEEIRGATLSQGTMDQLLEIGVIAPAGRKEAPGRPTLWATTPSFLGHFGLADLGQLPRREELLLDTTRPFSHPPAGIDAP